MIQSKHLTVVLLLLTPLFLRAQYEPKVPSFEEVISLHSPGTPVLSPDGRHVLFTVRRADWKKNRYDTEIWLSKDGQAAFQLTRNDEGSSYNPQWSPNGQWISFASERGNGNQLYVINPNGGEARAITNEKKGIGGYLWSPDGSHFVISKAQAEASDSKKRKERYGSFAVEDEEYRNTGLWLLKFDPYAPDPSSLPCYDEKDSTAQVWDCIQHEKLEPLIDSAAYHITSFYWAPDGKKIAFGYQPNSDIMSFMRSDLAVVDIESKEVKTVVENLSSDGLVDWSPDGAYILYESSLSDTSSNFYTNGKLFKVPVSGGKAVRLAQDFDENFGMMEWTKSGIYTSAFQKTRRPLFHIDPTTGVTKEVLNTPRQIYGFDVDEEGSTVALTGENIEQYREVYLVDLKSKQTKAITNFHAQVKDWKLAQSEVISWESKDGAAIEGVLYKPQDYDPAKKYPLLVIIHGGPTGIDRPSTIPVSLYPILQWLDKGALVLRPNYRGSAGYGEKFRALNVENLGVGDAWDVLSGVDYLDKKGMIDTDKMGAMGWSQGGYISAFLTTTTDRFKAISVGAGISNWMTYYVNTDIHPFTRQYLKATPWSNEEIYRKTSPMTYINDAKTPTLIQHGEFDRRVPVPNAYELYQGLQDVGVPVELVIYKGFGHGISKPKERLAATWHNWVWFNKYLWGEDLELPLGEEEK